MGGVTKYKGSDVKRFVSTKNVFELLDIDTRNAIECVEHHHPSIPQIINRMFSMSGPFIIDTDGLPLGSKITREACTEFENVYLTQGVRIAFHEFVMVVKRYLPRFLDYAVTVHISNSKIRQVDFLSEDIVQLLPKLGCKVEVRYMPIDPSMTEHEVSLLMMNRVFSRCDLLTLGIPNIGYQSVSNFKNALRH